MTLENIVIETLENCRYCLMCRHVAPLGLINHRESLTPHGMALTVASKQRGLIEWTPEVIDIIFSEPDSGNSRAHCVTDQPFSESIAAVRAELVSLQLAPAAVYDLQKHLEKWVTPFAQNPFQDNTQQADIALFLSDENIYLWDNETSVLELLEAINIKPAIVGRGRSNNFLAASLGLLDLARTQARALIDEISASGASRLIVLSPGDYYTLTQLYEERLGLKFPETVQVQLLSDLLSAQVDTLALKRIPDQAVAYIDPTHAVRLPNSGLSTRSLLTHIYENPPLELFWRGERAHPVGNTGVQFTHPEISSALTRVRLEDAARTGAEIIVSEDASTLHHLQIYAQEYGLEVKGLYQLIQQQR